MIIISEKYKVRNFNFTSFSRGNLVGGLPLGCSTESLGYPHGGTPRYFPWYFATKIKSYLPEVNFGLIRLQKVIVKVSILKSRKYEVVVVG